MLNSISCHPYSSDIWHDVGGWLFQWLTIPLALLPLFVLIGFFAFKQQLYKKRRLGGQAIVLLFFYSMTILVPAAGGANFVLIHFLPPDSGATTDAIVVLGRGGELRRSRVEVAAKLWKAHRAPTIFASGAGDADEIVKMLRNQGIPNRVLDGEHCSKTTEENAEFTAAALQPQGKKHIILVTDPPHLLRSLLTFRSMGFQVIPHSSPLPPSLAIKEKVMLTYKEYIKLAGYGLLGHFFLEIFLSSYIQKNKLTELSP